jgi:hypothetical protein
VRGTNPMPNFLTAGGILAEMITPAVLISASGTLVLSTSNRLGRVVDRIRVLAEVAEDLPEDSRAEDVVEKRVQVAEQVVWLSMRLGLLQTALTTFYVGIGLLVAASFTVGLSASAKGALAWIPVGFGLLGAMALLLGAVMLVREARLAVSSTRHELDHIRKVVDRKTRVRAPYNEKPEGGQGESGG